MVEAHSGTEALDHLAAGPFDLVISDVGMPEMSGWAVADEIRHRYRALPVILPTGWGSQIVSEEARVHAIHSVIAKPRRPTTPIREHRDPQTTGRPLSQLDTVDSIFPMSTASTANALGDVIAPVASARLYHTHGGIA